MTMSLNGYAREINRTAREHGFWDKERNFGEMLALMHSELSEALEEHRASKPALYFVATQKNTTDPSRVELLWSETEGLLHQDGTPISDSFKREIDNELWDCKPEGWAVELVDCQIRLLDTLQSANVDIDWITRQKMEYNRGRAHKHGKEY